MKKIYCVFCGKENNIEDQKCKECGKKLNPQEHPWKDYMLDHIKDDLKGKVTDKTISIITNYVKSHLYGVIMSALIIVTAGTGIVVSANQVPIKNVTSKPEVISTENLELTNELVTSLYQINTYNNDNYMETGFYEDKQVNYDSFTDENKLFLAYIFNHPAKEPYTFQYSCEEFQGYEYLYDWCIQDTEGSWFQTDFVNDEFNFIKIDLNSINQAYKNLFGTDKELPKKTFSIYYGTQCEYSTIHNNYMCYRMPAGWPGYQYQFTKLVKAESYGNTIYLYDYFIYVENGTFQDINKTRKISEEENIELVEQGQLYKHTYKKNENGTYHWVSSAPINELP